MGFAQHRRLSLGNIPRIHSFLKTKHRASVHNLAARAHSFFLSLAHPLFLSVCLSLFFSFARDFCQQLAVASSRVPDHNTRALNYAISQSVPQHKLQLATSFEKETHLCANKQTIPIKLFLTELIQNSKLSRSHDYISHSP